MHRRRHNSERMAFEVSVNQSSDDDASVGASEQRAQIMRSVEKTGMFSSRRNQTGPRLYLSRSTMKMET